MNVEMIVVEAFRDVLSLAYPDMVERSNVNDIAPATQLGTRVAQYFNMNIAESPSMWITSKEGEALAQFVIGES